MVWVTLISVLEQDSFPVMVINYRNTITDEFYGREQIRITPDFGIQILSSIEGTESHIYVNQSKINLSYEESNIELDSSGIRFNIISDIYVNGITAWSGTYSDGDGRTVTVTKGIITDVS